MIGMGDVDQCFRSLLTVLSKQIRHAVFRHHVVNMSSRGRHTGPRFQLEERSVAHLSALGERNDTVLTIRDTPFEVCEGTTIIGFPRSLNAAPYMKSTCPPTPE